MSYSLENLQLNTAFAHIEKGNYKAAAPIIRRFAEQGDVETGLVFTGEYISRIKEILSVKEIFRRLTAEVAAIG